MKYGSMEDLRNLSNNEVEDFLKRYWKTDELTFYGVFEPNTETPENYSGVMTKVKVPGSKMWLKYPLIKSGYVSFKVPGNKKLAGGYYKFTCHLLPTPANRCQLQILLNTLQEIDARTYDFVAGKPSCQSSAYKPKTWETKPKALPYRSSYAKNDEDGERTLSPLARRYESLNDEETGWGSDIQQLMGIYRKGKDGEYCIDDIRKSNMTKLWKYPKTTFRVGPLPLSKPVEGLTESQYCLFNWKFTFNVKVNPCEIAVDEDKPIVPISPKDFITDINNVADSQTVEPSEQEEKQTDVCVLLYDLLYDANKYTGTPVDVQFSLTDKYLSFQHTGRPLSAETILELCGVSGTNDRSRQTDIAYHCKGLREFLLANSHTTVISNGFFIRFDNVDGRLKAVWLEYSDLSRELKISLARNKRFTESVILEFDKDDSSMAKNYKVGLHCVFEDEQNIAFYSNIGKVAVKIKGGKTKTLDRSDWVVSKEYQTFIPKELRLKYGEKKHTSVMFACRHKGNKLVGEEEAPVFCLMPTATSLGFSFLMQCDIHINKTNFAVSRKDSWNKAYAEVAGRLFAKWITELSLKAEYTSKSIYGIVPKYDECIEQHPDEKALIEQFQTGFKAMILKETDEKKSADETKQETAAPYADKTVADAPTAKPSNSSSKPGKVYVIDTNIFVNCPDIISKMGSNDTIILSAKVVDELDNLKYKMEDEDLRNVQKALKNINQALDKGNVKMEMSDVRLLPRDFDRHNPDNNILSVLLRHKAESPTLLTSDNGLQIKAKGIGLNVIGLKEFLGK